MSKHKKVNLTAGIPDSVSPAGQVIWLVVLSVLFFLTLCFTINNTAKTTVIILIPLALLVGILGFRTLQQRIHLPLIILFLYVLMGGISTSYALSGKFALYEFLKLMAAICTTLILLAFTPGQGATPARRIATVLEGGAALLGFFSVDLISTRWFSTPLLSFLGNYSADYTNLPGVEPGVRITSILTHPNIFAGCVGIGVLLSLGLALSSPGKKERRVHLCCLMVTSSAFVLAFSMGAIASIGAAFLVYLILEHKERRSELFILMVETLVLTAIAAALTSMTALDTWDGFQPIPLLCLIVGAVLLCLADALVGQKLAQKTRGRGKLLLIIIVVILALLAAFIAVAFNMTGSITFGAGDSLRRSAYPAPGQYTLSALGDDGIRVTVETQNREDTMMHTSTVLYSGNLSGASFTVPEDSEVVYFTFRANKGAYLEKVTYEGAAGSGSIALGYKLLPAFIANRLQGLKANQNAIQRVVFFEDGIKLFKDSPIVGFGLGAFENAIHRVQSFFYETKYVHNHYIQTLLETGIIGLILFVGLLVSSALSIVLSRKKENFHPLLPALGALLVFMAIHGAVEVVFSSSYYLLLAFGVFSLINLCCGEALSVKFLGKKIRTVILIVVAVLLLFFGILLSNNMTAKRISSTQNTFDGLERALKLDRFEWADYALSYVVSSLQKGMPENILLRAEELAGELTQVNSNAIPLYLVEYYFSNGDMETAFDMAEKYGNYLSASSNAWNKLFAKLAQFEQSGAEYRAGLQRIVDLMHAWDDAHIGSIELSAENQEFLSRMSVN